MAELFRLVPQSGIFRKGGHEGSPVHAAALIENVRSEAAHKPLGGFAAGAVVVPHEAVGADAGDARLFEHGAERALAAARIARDHNGLRHAAEGKGARLKICRRRAGKYQRLPRDRVLKGDMPGMQHLAGGKTAHGRRRVDGVAQEGMAEAREMDADLVRASRENAHAQERSAALRI